MTPQPEKDIGLSPVSQYPSPAPRFERQATLVGPRTGDEERDSFGYPVFREIAASPEEAKR